MKHLPDARVRLLSEIDADVRATRGYTGIDRLSPPVRAALEAVDRAAFVPADLAGRAYDNLPLPIGHGQTISQPFVVALMSEVLHVEPDDIVLEIGAGCGYQTAVLARLAREVISIERLPELARAARERLHRMGIANASVHTGDGYYGWPERAPYPCIMVTAAARAGVPPPLLGQLADGGRLVAPVEGPDGSQDLLLVKRAADGTLSSRALLPVTFVPLTRDPPPPQEPVPPSQNGQRRTPGTRG